MGFSDIGCFGSEIETPNLDALAEGGIRFSQLYNCARCCPTRASLLTGLHPHQAGIGHMVKDKGAPAYQGYLRQDTATIAESLKASGYRTYMAGKWHVGGEYAVHLPETWNNAGDATHPLPRQRGFDKFYGMLCGAGSYFNPPTLMRDDTFIEPEGDDYYITDAITDEAIGMLREAEAEGKGEPFFLYLAYTAPHWPLHARREDIEKYRGRYKKGWEALRRERHERLIEKGILDRNWKLSPRDEHAAPWEEVEHKDWEDLRMAVYAAQVDNLDRNIGKLREYLRNRGQEEDTMIVFLSDNGGCAEYLREDGQPGTWPEMYSLPTPDGRIARVGNDPGREPGPADTFMSYDLPWANASNTPFRLFKCWVHEGGISSPCLISWPGGIASDGRIHHNPWHVTDITATLLEACGAEPLAEREGRRVQRPEGESFLKLFSGTDASRATPIFWEHEGNRAVRKGPWKLVSRHPDRWELYNMDEDRTELNDLAATHGEMLKQMVALYQGWAARCGVRDWDTVRSGRLRPA